MPTTTNVPLTNGADWVQIGGVVNPLVIQNEITHRVVEFCFSATEPSSSLKGHLLKSSEFQSGVLGSQMWARSTSGDITVIVTEG